jgi:hypothetical protein
MRPSRSNTPRTHCPPARRPKTPHPKPQQVISEALPALAQLKAQGLVRFVGVTGLPLKALTYVLDRAPPGSVDVVLSYCHYCLNDTALEHHLAYLQDKQVTACVWRGCCCCCCCCPVLAQTCCPHARSWQRHQRRARHGRPLERTPRHHPLHVCGLQQTHTRARARDRRWASSLPARCAWGC